MARKHSPASAKRAKGAKKSTAKVARPKRSAAARKAKPAGKAAKRAAVATKEKKARKTAGGNPAAKAATRGKKTKAASILSRKQIGEFREMLLEKRRTLLGDIDGMKAEALHSDRDNGDGDLSSMPFHMADIGTDNYEQEFTLGLLESERQLLREIDEALGRIVGGTYGICMGTGEPITKARLRAKPWAKYCIDYARKLEQGLVRRPEPSFNLDDDADSGSSSDSDADSADDYEQDRDE